MSAWLFDIFMAGCMREMKGKVGRVGARVKMNGMSCVVVVVVACLFADDTVLFAESEEKFQSGG